MKKNNAELAVEDFNHGFSCSQAVVAVFAGPLGLKRELALKIATGFGGGMARLGQTCGAVSGAFMVIGLAHGRADLEDTQAKEKTYELANRFAELFSARYHGLTCPQLLGYDIGKPDEAEKVKNENLFNTRCPLFVRSAVDILEEILDIR